MSSSRRSEDELKVPSQRSDEAGRDGEHRDLTDGSGDRYDDTTGRHDGGYPNDAGHTSASHGYAPAVPDRDHDDEPSYKDPYASTGDAGDLPTEPHRETPLGHGADHRSPDPDPAHAGVPADETPGHETSRDVLSGPGARHDDRSDDVLVHSDRSDDVLVQSDRSDDVLVHGDPSEDRSVRGDRPHDELAHDGRAQDDDVLVHGERDDDDLARDNLTPAGAARDGLAAHSGLTDHRRTDGEFGEGGRPVEGAPLEGAPVQGAPVEGAPVDDVPSHAAPLEVALFDQDPAEVQARWRDVQASFVDDPAEAIQRADGLVGEVVESLTNSLTSRTGALRERWKDVDSPDTEDLRQAFRDYRNVLERLLALSTHNLSAETRR
ncbi:hypothetical protein ACFYUV_09455 [Nonomuraea sp. NPDC003560]|uniref:hypothetical protein n=1 Tax=Nonomuraea sp. NPDC003560 TaxID=3364341 RepID=UPI00367580B2